MNPMTLFVVFVFLTRTCFSQIIYENVLIDNSTLSNNHAEFDSQDHKVSNLSFDLYMPEQGEDFPLLIFLHGGAFVFGSKDEYQIELLGREFSRQGVAFCALEYRTLAVPLLSPFKAVFPAMQDLHQSLYHFLNQGKDYNISSENIFIGGISAGAITAIHYAFMDKNEIDASLFQDIDNQFGCLKCPKIEKSNIRGIININGGIQKLDFLLNEDSNLLQFYGESDLIISPSKEIPFLPLIQKETSNLSELLGISFKEDFQKLGDELLLPKLYGSKEIQSYSENLPKLNSTTYSLNKGHRVLLDKSGEKPMASFYTIVDNSVDWIHKHRMNTSKNSIAKQLRNWIENLKKGIGKFIKTMFH